MGDAGFMLSSMMNTSYQNSVTSYTLEAPCRNSFTTYSPSAPEAEYYLDSPPHIITSSVTMPGIANGYPVMAAAPQETQPYLVILEEPVTRIRYRYASEKGAHGGLQGINSSQGKKTFPQVKLENAPPQRKVYIKASLYTNEDNPKHHVHKLTGKHCDVTTGDCKVELNDENVATFQGLGILFTGKKEVPKILLERRRRDISESQCNVYYADESLISEQVEREAKDMNLNSVLICFEAFDAEKHVPICNPAFSKAVQNQKSPESGELRIAKISRCSGSCTGGDEVFLLCEKVNKKEIKIRFYDEEHSWENYASFNETDVHHQVAIVFRTPPYARDNIEHPVTVNFQLYRPKDGEFSDSFKFIYKPVDKDQERVALKRKKLDCGDSPHSYHHSQYPASSSSSVGSARQDKMPSSYAHMHGSPTYQTRGGTQMRERPSSTVQRSSDSDSEDISDLITFPEPSSSADQVTSTTVESSVPVFGDVRDVTSLGEESRPSTSEASSFITGKDIYLGGPFLGDDDDTDVPSHFATDGSFDEVLIQSRTENNSKVYRSVTSPIDSAVAIVRDVLHLVVKALYQFLALGEIHRFLRPLRRLMGITDEDGDNAVHHIALQQSTIPQFAEGCLETVRHLPPNVINQTNNRFQTPLQLAVAVGKLDVVQRLLECRANPNIQDSNGCTAVHLCVLKHRHDCLRALLNSPFVPLDLDLLNYEGYSALHLAVQGRCRECVRSLCSAKTIDVNTKDGTCGRAALHFAAEYSRELVDDLLDHKDIDVDAQDYSGNTALHLACGNGTLEVALKLMRKDANPLVMNYQRSNDEGEDECEDSCGRTPFDLAAGNEMLRDILAGTVSNVRDVEIDGGANDGEKKTNTSSEGAVGGEDIVLSRLSLDEGNEKTEGCNKTFETDFRDSGFISSEIKTPTESAKKRLCELLDPPNSHWEKLAEICCDKKYIPALRKQESSPTSIILKSIKDEELEDYLLIANLSEFIPVLRGQDQ